MAARHSSTMTMDPTRSISMSGFRPPEKPQGLEARGLKWRKSAKNWVAYWIARVDLVDKGYTPETQRLWPPSAEPTAELTDDVWTYLGSECERLQEEMLAWSRGETAPISTTEDFDDTMASLVRIYKDDED